MAVWDRRYINNLPDSAFLFIEPGGTKDSEGKTKPRSLRHLPYKDSSGKVDLPHLRNAIQRAPQIVLSNGNKISPEKARSIQERARKIMDREQKKTLKDIWKSINLSFAKMFGTMSAEEEKERTENKGHKSVFIGTQDGGDTYTWIVRYSNAYKDRDSPPDIISSESHKKFVQAVQSGDVSLPELWLMHSEKLRVGQAQWVAFDAKNKIALAGGYFYPFANGLAKHIAENKSAWRLSHGMPTDSIRRDEKGVIVNHVTREITLAPATLEANMLTDVVYIGTQTKTSEESIMDILQQLKEHGVPEDVLNEIIEGNAELASAANSAGIASKTKDDGSKEGAESAAEENTEDKTNSAEGAEEGGGEDKGNSDKTAADELLKSLVTEIAGALQPYIETVKGVEARLNALEQRFEKAAGSDESKGKKQDGDEDDSDANDMSKASLGKLLQDALASVAHETEVDGRTKLAKQKPKESKGNAGSVTPFSWLDEIIVKE